MHLLSGSNVGSLREPDHNRFLATAAVNVSMPLGTNLDVELRISPNPPVSGRGCYKLLQCSKIDVHRRSVPMPIIDPQVHAYDADIQVTAEAEQALHARGVLKLPGFIENTGGVICAAVEYRGGTVTRAFQEIGERVRQDTREVLQRSADEKVLPRTVADKLAGERIHRAMSVRRWTSPSTLSG
jgi:hypothetical protein